MYKKTITYTDYNGNERTEDFYFNLTEADVAKMELRVKGGFVEYVNRIIANQDQASLIDTWENIIKSSFGVKTPDGRSFMRDETALAEFMATEAYSKMFMEFLRDADAAGQFINGIVPNKDKK